MSCFKRRGNEGSEQRMGLDGAGFELGMELDAHEPAALCVFHDFHLAAGGADSGDFHACGLIAVAVRFVELKAVAVTLADSRNAVNLLTSL